MELTGIESAFQTAIGTVQTDVLSMITIALPVVLAIVGAVLAVRFGIRFFKTTAKG